MAVLAAAGWLGGLAGVHLRAPLLTGLLVAGLVALVLVHRRRPARVLAAGLLVAAAVAGVAALRAEANRRSPLAVSAAAGRFAELIGRVSDDPATRHGQYGAYALARVQVRSMSVDGVARQIRAPVLVIGDAPWSRARLGSTVAFGGRLRPADGPDLAAIVVATGPPRIRAGPGHVLAAAASVRAAIRESVAGTSPSARALVPALVVGDRERMPATLVADFRTCGLTHLAAVSGTNLTLVVGFLMIVARWVGMRARALTLVGCLGVIGFVLLARPEPSVLRAAAMGSVGLFAMSGAARDSSVRALGVAVLALLLFDPWLAMSVGFALSALATAGIVLVAPAFRDAMARWLPRWAAEAVAVPLAAQLACTPLIAAISGQVSLIAVAANLAAAPAVGPATVLGLGGGLLTLLSPPVGHLVGWLAAASAGWIITVATHLAALPGAAVAWSAGAGALAVLAVLTVAAAALARRVLTRPGRSLVLGVLLVALVWHPLPVPGWPPAGWVLVACDVGQGDGLVLNAGNGESVVVDTGPDPVLMRGCLQRLGVHDIPVIVLTHFHADHVDGLPGVLAGHRVGEIDVTSVRVPSYGAAEVDRWARAAHVPLRVPGDGEVRRVGALTWQVIGPVPGLPGTHESDEGTVANNSSLVLLVRVDGIRILMSGDMQTEAQQALAARYPHLHVDVLKVPHHGSRFQDPALLSGLGARLAVISVGAHNDYGHPAPSTVALLRSAGMQVRRTDRDGDVAVVVRDGRLGVATH